MPNIKIIGAGIAGAVAAGYFSSSSPTIYESSNPEGSKLNKHKAVMRIRDPRIGMILGADMKEVDVYKQCLFNKKLYWESDIRMRNLYSKKINDCIAAGSISDLGKVKRYLLMNFEISNVVYGASVTKFEKDSRRFFFEKSFEPKSSAESCAVDYDFCISTIPVFKLLEMVDIDTAENFSWKDIYVTRIEVPIKSEVHQTIYVPEESYCCYRVTLEGQKMIFESINSAPSKEEIEELSSYFGIEEVGDLQKKQYIQKMGKIFPINDDARRARILTLTEKYGIYSLGRFSVWKKLRVDDLIPDLDRIRKMMEISDTRRKYESKFN